MTTPWAAPIAAAAVSAKKEPKQLPVPNSDFHQLGDVFEKREPQIHVR
jgi:hypothetical protein